MTDDDMVDVFAYDCPLCWDTGVITVMEPRGREDVTVAFTRRCPEGCPPLDVDSVHDPAAVIPRQRARHVPP